MVGMTLRARMDFKIQSYQGEINAKQSRMPKPKLSKLSTIFGHGFGSVNLVETVEPEQSRGELMHFDVFV